MFIPLREVAIKCSPSPISRAQTIATTNQDHLHLRSARLSLCLVRSPPSSFSQAASILPLSRNDGTKHCHHYTLSLPHIATIAHCHYHTLPPPHNVVIVCSKFGQNQSLSSPLMCSFFWIGKKKKKENERVQNKKKSGGRR